MKTTLTVNGIAYPVDVDPGTSLLAAVRGAVGLTGAKEGCDDSECGACMMLLDGKPVNSCSYLALQAEGSEVTTVEGLADGARAQRSAGGDSRARRRPVRVLHAGDAHLRNRAARREPEADRGRRAHRTVRQPLPLHGLRRHRQGRPERRPVVAGQRLLRRVETVDVPPANAAAEAVVGDRADTCEEPRPLPTGRARVPENVA